MSDALAQELAAAAELEEDEAYVKANEVASLAKSWPTYRGRQIGTDDIRAWLEQVALHKNQRLLFTILKNIRIFTEVEVREKLKSAFRFLRPKLPEVTKIKGKGRAGVVITYLDGEGKSGQFYSARFAEENQIPTRSIISPVRFSQLLQKYVTEHGSVDVLVVVDDIVGTGDTLATKLTEFVLKNENILRGLGKPLVALVLTGTQSGCDRVMEAMEKFHWLDFDLRVCDPLLRSSFAFDHENGIWASTDEFERAKSLCRDLGINIYPAAPFGFEDQGLLIVFPDTCPDNTLPIIHSAALPDAPRKWQPLFPRITN
jgi:hypothetical protein